MYEAHAAIVGKVISDPIKRTAASGDEVMSFRMASNARRQDRNTGEWVGGGTLYVTVSCWRRLVSGVGASIMRGDPIIAYGQLRSSQYTTKDGVERNDLELRATAIGPDLARCTVKVERPRRVSVEPVVLAPTESEGAPDVAEATETDVPVAV
ncbi:single-stranded DNA-binding protein [Skermania sp. ID1734]|uniref:single-stranded DNA-binding protein n=1 Tax=Skermania sp. ID1734 TaxID=2597516 RepID=UPI00118017D7|nr:single-stranded DNA-binding protein [Skermania sp. ID1734]TSE00166.1 single-stranded DNA-binding protein [Skermania sp. ID1734]